MNPADHYRTIAAQLRSNTARTKSAEVALQWEHLANCYMRLAEQADQNSFQDLWFEFGPFARRVGDVHRCSDRDLCGPNRGELPHVVQ